MMHQRKGQWFFALAAVVFLAHGAAQAASPAGEAPRNGMMSDSSWSTGIKQAVGTAYEAYDDQNAYSSRSRTAPLSKVWFTAGRGVLNEIYWPTLDTAQVKDSQMLVTGDQGFFFEESKDSVTKIEWLGNGIPAFKIVNREASGKFEIEKTIFTDPDRDVVIQRFKITRNVSGLRFYVLHKPAVENTPLGDSALVRLDAQPALLAWQTQHAQAVVFSIPLRQASAGFAGSSSDGWQDLRADGILHSNYAKATNGNVVLTAALDIPEAPGTTSFDMVIGFGNTAETAYQTARTTLARPLDAALNTYVNQWKQYQSEIGDLSVGSGDGGKLFRASVAVLKSSEDKTYAGAIVASPSVPWGNHAKDPHSMPIADRRDDNQTAGYHAVWPRDLFQMATSFMAVEDYASAIASLNYLRRIQYKNSGELWEYDSRVHSRDGSWCQSVWVDGSPRWKGLQMDETAMPLMLVYRLWKAGKIDPSGYWEMVRLGADFVADFGPWSAMERWEESMGASPSNIAAMIASLWTSAEIAQEMGDTARAEHYRAVADAWSAKPGDNLDTWLFTTVGSHGNHRYFQRVEGAVSFLQTWDPNDNARMTLANGAGQRREADVIDGGFLELVRYGVRSALNANILDTLPEYDQTIRFEVPGHGPGFMRYTGDRYNYSDLTGQQTDGMLWPLLSGERAHYELARAIELGISRTSLANAVDPYIRTIELFATEELMIPEQVWREGLGAGHSTGAATPLGWSHAEYLKLLRSRIDHKVFDRIQIAADRRQSLDALVRGVGWEEARRILR